MNTPLVTIVHNKKDGFCRLLLLYNQDKYYYSENKAHSDLRDFKNPYLIDTHTDSIILHSRHHKNKILVINLQ